MLDVTIPELLRTSLSEVCLQTKLLINDSTSIENFLLRCIAGPSIANIRQSIKYLQKLGALDEKENLTLLGSHLAHMPVDSKYGKMLIYAIIFRCLDPILSLVSILTMGEQIFMLPISSVDRNNCVQWRKNVAGDSHSDHFMMLRVFQMWLNLKNSHENDRQFCEENYISRNHIEHVRGVRRQILSYLESNLIPKSAKNLNENSENWSLLKAVICAGLYPFIAKIERRRGTMYTEIDIKLSFHMSSVLCVKKEGYKSTIKKLPAEWGVFEEKNRIGRMCMLKCNTLLNSFTVSLSAGMNLEAEDFKLVEEFRANSGDSGWTDEEWEDMAEYEFEVDMEPEYTDFKVDKFVKFTSSKEEATMILNLKRCLNNLVTKFLSDKHFKPSNEDNALIKVFARVIEKEDISSGMIKMDISEKTVEKTMVNSRIEARNNHQGQRGQRYPQNTQQRFIPSPSYQNQNQRPNTSQNWRSDIPPQNQRPPQNWRSNLPAQNQRQNSYENRPSVAPRRKLEVRSSGSQKFIILKVNSKKCIENMASKVVLTLEELNLKIWQFHKIKSIAKSGTQIYIIFYSTHKNEFQGYGEVLMINENLPMQFHFRHPKTVKLEELRDQRIVMEIGDVVNNPSFNFYELHHLVGNSLIPYFQ